MTPDSPGGPTRLSDSLPAAETSDLGESVQLLNRAQGGDRAALDALLTRYQDRLRRIVRIRLSASLGERVEVDDITQETLVKVAEKIDDFELRSHAGILQWMARIAENQIRDHHRYHRALKRDGRKEIPLRAGGSTDSAGHVEPAADQTAVPERVSRQELRALLDETLATLQEDHREVILLRDYSGADWDLVSRTLSRSKEACQELHRRAWVRARSAVLRKLQDTQP